MLERSGKVAERATQIATTLVEARNAIRNALVKGKAIVEVGAFDDRPPLRAAGIDGALVTSRKQFGDLVAVVAVEAPICSGGNSCAPGDERFDLWMDSVPRSAQNSDVLGAIMATMELRTAQQSQAELVMMDGSFVSAMLAVLDGSGKINALPSTDGHPNPLGSQFKDRLNDELRQAILDILASPRHVAFPKYTTSNEFAQFNLPEVARGFDAKTIASIALMPGERTLPLPPPYWASDRDKTHLSYGLGYQDAKRRDAFFDLLDGVRTIYYRPHPWVGAIRLDFTDAAIGDKEWIDRVLKTVYLNTMTAGIAEPLPLYFADMWAKQISVGVAPAIDIAAVSTVTDPEIKLLLALDYRTTK
jgi:hypothetical protein